MTGITITVLDVGHGAAAVFQAADCICLIDTGSGSTVLEYMTSVQPLAVDTILISHADRDHAGGLIGLLSAQEFEIRNVWLNADAFKGTKVWRDLAYELERWERDGGGVQLGVRQGNRLRMTSLEIDVLAPRTRLAALGPGSREHLNRRLETNSLSVVARVMLDDKPVALFPGDLDELGLDHLLDQPSPPSLQAPVLVFPHHGGHVERAGNERTNAAFAERLMTLVGPSTVIFSTGRNEHATPRPEIVEVVRSMVPDVRIACTQLSKRCAADGPLQQATHLTEVVARGRTANSCCAGSIVIKIDETGRSVAPDAASHVTFIDLHAPTALCR